MWVANGFVHELLFTPRCSRRASTRAACLFCNRYGGEPPMISSASVVATWRSASRSVSTYCFMVNATPRG
jgi:hypothetical protein